MFLNAIILLLFKTLNDPEIFQNVQQESRVSNRPVSLRFFFPFFLQKIDSAEMRHADVAHIRNMISMNNLSLSGTEFLSEWIGSELSD